MHVCIIVGPYPDCSRCDHTKGQTWFSDPDNCHLFYICEKIDDNNGSWHYIVHHPTCGELFWNQQRLTCVTTVPGNCTVGDVVTFPTLSTTHGKHLCPVQPDSCLCYVHLALPYIVG